MPLLRSILDPPPPVQRGGVRMALHQQWRHAGECHYFPALSALENARSVASEEYLLLFNPPPGTLSVGVGGVSSELEEQRRSVCPMICEYQLLAPC